MFHHILVPVDLSIKDDLKRAIEVATDQARHYGAKLTFISVVGGLQAKVSNSAGKYASMLEEFAQGIEREYGVKAECQVIEVPDPSVEVDGKVLETASRIGVDLIIMGSHQPGWAEYFVNSHGGRIASHAPISVFVVREDE